MKYAIIIKLLINFAQPRYFLVNGLLLIFTCSRRISNSINPKYFCFHNTIIINQRIVSHFCFISSNPNLPSAMKVNVCNWSEIFTKIRSMTSATNGRVEEKSKLNKCIQTKYYPRLANSFFFVLGTGTQFYLPLSGTFL